MRTRAWRAIIVAVLCFAAMLAMTAVADARPAGRPIARVSGHIISELTDTGGWSEFPLGTRCRIGLTAQVTDLGFSGTNTVQIFGYGSAKTYDLEYLNIVGDEAAYGFWMDREGGGYYVYGLAHAGYRASAYVLTAQTTDEAELEQWVSEMYHPTRRWTATSGLIQIW